MQTPPALEPHQSDYHPQAWLQYSLMELGMWVHLLAKRAEHRLDPEKQAKDLYDAQNYLSMMKAKLDELQSKAGHS
jgi:hypothetical protein